jgi:hypothetical protein
MSLGVTKSTRSGPYFQARTVPRLTALALEAVGLSPRPFAALTMDVLRLSPKGKWHVPGQGLDRCSHLTRAYGYRPTRLPVQAVGVLGEYDFCSFCAHRVRLPGPAGVFYAVAGLIVAATQWVAEFEQSASSMDWLDVARWTCRTPFGPPDPMPERLAQMAGARGWARHRLSAQGIWNTLQDRTEAALAIARQAAGPPGLRVLAARARDLVARDPETMAEASAIQAIANTSTRFRDFGQPDLCKLALDSWLAAVAVDGDARAGHAAMSTAVEARYANAQVRDVSLLPEPALTPVGEHTSPAAWATVEFAEVRRRLVGCWCDRLGDALRHAQDVGADTERLLLVAGWPIINSPDREIAYLTQYPILDRAVITARDIDPFPAPDEIPWAVVLRVPAFAAEHAAAHRSDHLSARAGGTTLTRAQPADLREVRDLLRVAARYLPADAEKDPATGLPAVLDWRAGLYHRTDLDAWASAGGQIWDLPPRWQWTPSEVTDSDGPNGTATLAHLVHGLHQRGEPAVLHLAAGQPDALNPVDVVVHPRTIETSPSGVNLVYAPWSLPNCPTVRVPIHRIIAISDPR